MCWHVQLPYSRKETYQKVFPEVKTALVFIEFKSVALVAPYCTISNMLGSISYWESINTMNIFVHIYDITTQPTICLD